MPRKSPATIAADRSAAVGLALVSDERRNATAGHAPRRILVLQCAQEVSTFNPVPSTADDFEITAGAAFIDSHRGRETEVAGALDVLESTPTVTVVPGFGAWAYSAAGTLTAAGFRTLTDGFLGAIRENRGVDGIYACLHGSMVAAGEEDPEGFLLEATRALIGDEIPIVISLDLHGVLTRRMLRHADAVVCYLTYPHVDFRDTGRRAARLLLRILDDGVRPVTARVAIPALVRGPELITETGRFGRFTRRAAEFEREPVGLAAGVLISNPFTDVPELTTSVFATTDGDPERAATEAVAIASGFWDEHEAMVQPLLSLDDAVAEARAVAAGTAVMVDAADATSSGASGDSAAVLQALVRGGYAGRVLAPIVDAPAVDQAFAAGVGATIRTTIGGRLDPARFEPMPFEAEVLALGDGRFVNESDGLTWNAGRTAVLRSGAVTVVATSRPVMLYDRSLFLAFGQDAQAFDAVVVKSPRCEPRFFDDWAAAMIDVDAPGSTSANLRSLGHVRCPRPIFPLDDDVPFMAKVELYARPRTGIRVQDEVRP
jgi:microcystin degradation protein MlrC